MHLMKYFLLLVVVLALVFAGAEAGRPSGGGGKGTPKSLDNKQKEQIREKKSKGEKAKDIANELHLPELLVEAFFNHI